MQIESPLGHLLLINVCHGFPQVFLCEYLNSISRMATIISSHIPTYPSSWSVLYNLCIWNESFGLHTVLHAFPNFLNRIQKKKTDRISCIVFIKWHWISEILNSIQLIFRHKVKMKERIGMLLSIIIASFLRGCDGGILQLWLLDFWTLSTIYE